ncbi:MAG TPA: hypothetical protein VK153_01915 [Candidatus Paceibacterota bacterium]|nr:hypothetical protein [Candidatus Paceibacterota bacterium]
MTKAKAITNDITQNINTQKTLLRILIIGSVMLFSVYIYLIGSITFNVIARKSLENTEVELKSRVNQLDLAYLSSINKMDKEYALSLGFVDANNNIFASRDINHVAIR